MTRTFRPQIMILCEDKAHLDFIKGFLKRGGWSDRSIISRDVCPPGSQSGEAWVRKRYTQSLKTLRSRHGQGRNVALLVMTDWDTDRTQDRKAQLDSELARVPGEPVAIFVPKRNIESWFAFLDGQNVSEDVNYKSSFGKGTPNGKYGKKLWERCSRNESEPMPASLQDACREWNALKTD